jgi:catechol 2,3-dioxygenase-like lactoylglutathione lyase family enzyme
MAKYDRSVEDIGNVVMLEHVNTRVPDQHLATAFYVTGLGLTRDPFIMTGTNNMWINVGRSQFHLPSGGPQVLRGVTGIVIEGRAQLVERLGDVEKLLSGTRFSWRETEGAVEVTCPWGNRIRIHEPGPEFANTRLGMPYVQLDVPSGVAEGIVRFYREIMATPASVEQVDGAPAARVSVGDGQVLIFREFDEEAPAFDGHHIAVYLADFSAPYNKLMERGLITEESDQHQYRFLDIVDPESGDALFCLEHEVRSMRHPMYARPLVNRNPAINNRNYVPGYQEMAWASA